MQEREVDASFGLIRRNHVHSTPSTITHCPSFYLYPRHRKSRHNRRKHNEITIHTMSSVFQRRRNSRWTQDDTPNNSNNGNPGSSAGNPTLPLQPITGLARRNTNDNFFPPGGARNVQASPSTGPQGQPTTHDSLTLGQLKAANVAAQPKEKVSSSR